MSGTGEPLYSRLPSEPVRCPACQNDNPRYPQVPYCDVCGTDLGSPARGTTLEPPLPPAAPANPHQKRRTVFEPAPAAAPKAAPLAAPVADFFAHPPPPRPPLNPRDPFVATNASTGEAPHKGKTVIAAGPEGDAPRARVRGALFEYRGPTDAGRVHPVRVGRNVLGREPTCDIVVDDGRVSGQHAYLFLRADDATLLDVSTNGSRVDGKVVNGEQATLQHGSVIELGDSLLVLALIPEATLQRGGG